jgi:hypothetical protein
MAVPQADRSIYYKGLLILVGRDRIVELRERELMIRIGQILDFDKRFCEAALNDLLSNVHIKGKPVVFPDIKLAQCFLEDAIRLGLVDQELHPRELGWLKSVARANAIADEWLNDTIRRFSEQTEALSQSPLAIQQYL